jgi:hypothetical protein
VRSLRPPVPGHTSTPLCPLLLPLSSAGTPNLAAIPCAAPGDRSQDFIVFSAGGIDAIMSVTASAVLDIPGSDVDAGARIELYGSNGGSPNQRWAFNAAAGTIASALNGYCVAAC